MYKNKKQTGIKKNGFTLIELLVVIVILGILAVIGLRSFASSQMKARDSQRKTDLRTISTALDIFYNDLGSYPDDNGDGMFIACGTSSALASCTPGGVWSVDGNIYVVQLPVDPSTGVYYYQAGDDNRSFRIFARLENEYDRDVPKSGGNPTHYTAPPNGACGVAGNCNYGRSSTNVDLGAVAP